jgi:mono/diheme cytochrome c family protein
MNKISALVLACTAGVSLAAHAAIDLAKLPPASAQKDITYAKDIKPLFEASCIRCHGEREHKGGIRLDSLEGVLKGGKDGPIVEAGHGEKSSLVISVSQLDPETAMPPKRKPGGRGGRPPGMGGTNAPGTNAPGMNRPPRDGEHGTNAPAGEMHGTNAPAMGGRPPQPQAKPFTPEQVGLVRAWVDQGAK